MFNGIKIVWLWGEKWAKFSPKMVKKQSFFDFFRFSRKLSIPFERFFYSHSTSYFGPLCAISLNSDGWDVRNIAKIKRRGTKNQPVFDYFDFHKNCPFDSNEFLYSPSTLYYGLLGVVSSRLNCCDVNNITKVSPKMAKNSQFLTFFDFCKNCPNYSNDFLYSHSTPYYGPLCAISLNSDGWDVRNIAKMNRGGPKINRFSTFLIFTKTVHTIGTKFRPVLLHYIMVVCV